MGQSLAKIGGTTVRDAIDTEEWLTDGCANASKRIMEVQEPIMRDILQRWKDNPNDATVYLDQYSALVYRIAEEMLGQCTPNQIEVFVRTGGCLGTRPVSFRRCACQ